MNSSVMPPGESDIDPAVKDIDPIAYAMDRVRTYLAWIDEHRASFELYRESDLEAAERELRNLSYCTRDARAHMARLVELLLAGYTINPSKRLPRDLERFANQSAIDPS